MFNKIALGLIFSGFVGAQSLNLKIDLSKDSPVTLITSDWRDSTSNVRGAAYLVNVHASLSLRNSSQKRIRGVTLAVLAQEVTPGGKGSVSVPSLDVAPNDTFNVRIDVPLLRPLSAGQNIPAVEVRLDGVLFEDLSFYGPDALHSQRNMTVWELEARRDRKFFKNVLETAGREGLQKEILASLSRQDERLQPGVQMVRGKSTNVEPERQVEFAFLEMPEAPVEAFAGSAKISATEARAPHFEVRNKSNRAVQALEIGWVVRNQEGHEFLAASLPADANLAPGKSGEALSQDTALKFQEPVVSMSGFVSRVEFADGTYWIPSRASIDTPRFRALVAPSPEEQRLTQIYKKKGPQALIDELKKF
jgi:hypothetical protein